VNILFVNYGDFTTNSLNHIGGFANTLSARGHACIVAVPGNKTSISAIADPLFAPATYDEVLTREVRFLDGRPADVVHAWTPREGVRKFVVAYQRALEKPARLVVHLEDNETYLFEGYTGLKAESLASIDSATLDEWLVDGLPNPLRFRAFLALADGVTVITERLRELVPPSVPTQLLPPGVDLDVYRPLPADTALRADLGLTGGEKVIVLTGSNTFANEAEIRELYLAVALLNQRGTPTRLVRTGFNSPQFKETLPTSVAAHVIDLGFVEKAKLPRLLALADVLVQPGRPGRFNDYRLPSKLPEFLASGRPVILPPTNLALAMQDGREALLLRDGSPEEIAELAERVFADPALAARLGEAGRAFAAHHFDLARNSAALAAFYDTVSTGQSNTLWTKLTGTQGSDLALMPLLFRHELAAGAGAEQLAENLSVLIRHEETRHAELARRAAEADKLKALTEQHAKNLGETLAAERRQLALTKELSSQHIKNLERGLETAQGNHRQAEIRTAQLRLQLAETERVARERVDDAERRIAKLTTELTHAKAVIATRDFKIDRMQRSFSWRSTAWLRSLRRLLVDPFAPPPKQPPYSAPALEGSREHERVDSPGSAGRERVDAKSADPSTAPDAPRYHYTYNFDHPRNWRTSSNKLLILGWCFENEAAPIKGIRAHFCGEITEGIYGSKRLDVLASVGGKKQAEYCGIKLELKTTIGEHQLVLELQHEDGWHPFFSTTVHVGAPGDPGERTEYEKWCEQHEMLTPEDERAITAHIARFSQRPLISIVMPTYNSPEELLVKAIASVRAQVYPHWELCIADDCSTAPHVRRILEAEAAKEPRIKLTFRTENGHISRASNTALELATGDWVGLFDHDDVLHRMALYFVAAEIDAHPDAELIYTDEDKIDGEDRRFDPYFKPDWNPDLFHAQNYTSHLSVFRTARLREIGGFRAGFEGSQDWDLTLRAIERIEPNAIRHIPRVLYHWRAVPGSTALQLAEKSYPVDAAKRALLEHFQRKGEQIELKPVPGDHWRVKYRLPDTPPLVSLIIPTRNALKLTRQAVESIVTKTTYPNYEILIVDNNSDDPETLKWFDAVAGLVERGPGSTPPATPTAPVAGLAEPGRPSSTPATPHPPSTHADRQVRVKVLRFPGPFNYSAINNFAVTQAAGEVVGLLNNDIEVINPDWADELVSHALRPGIGAVGGMLYYPMDTVQHAGVVLGLGGVAGHPFKEFPRNDGGQKNRLRVAQNYSAVTAACLFIRKERYLEVGGLDEVSLAVAFNDVDLCCKLLTAGYRNVWTPFAELYHHESATRGVEDTPEKKARFQSEVETMMTRWAELLANDPAYNPNLTLVGEDFSPAYLPRLKKPWLI
jgi:O-antigen biosynthesis protein